MGDVYSGTRPLVRVHINRSARDLLAIESPGDPKSWSFHRSMERISAEGRGVLVLL